MELFWHPSAVKSDSIDSSAAVFVEPRVSWTPGIRASLHLFALIALCVLSGCAHHRKVSVPRAPRVGDVETGIASWYGNPYHGRRAANGEIYDMEKLTAAHRTLPFGTWVSVYDLDTGKSVNVRITDRGPFVAGRIIDLSHAAAQVVGMIGPGLARVRLQVIPPPPDAAPPIVPPSEVATAPTWFAVQVGAFKDRDRAEQLRARLVRQYGAAEVVRRDGKPILWRVLVGHEPAVESANGLAARLKTEQTGFSENLVVRLDDLSSAAP